MSIVMNENIIFRYLYRDGANYKAWNDVVFANPSNITLKEIERRLKQAFDSEQLFIADQVRIPEVFLYIGNPITRDDHCYHEFDSVAISEEVPSDVYARSILRFIEEVEEASQSGWQAFNPADRL